jgi:hypothetical protein
LYADYNGKVWNLSDKESKITYVLSEVIKLISQCKGYEDVLITREYNSRLTTVKYHNIFYKILLCYNRVYNKDTFFDINNKGRIVASPYDIENIIKLIRHSILIDIDYINDIKNKSIDDKLSLLDELGGISITIKKLLKINEKCGDKMYEIEDAINTVVLLGLCTNLIYFIIRAIEKQQHINKRVLDILEYISVIVISIVVVFVIIFIILLLISLFY